MSLRASTDAAFGQSECDEMFLPSTCSLFITSLMLSVPCQAPDKINCKTLWFIGTGIDVGALIRFKNLFQCLN